MRYRVMHIFSHVTIFKIMLLHVMKYYELSSEIRVSQNTQSAVVLLSNMAGACVCGFTSMYAFMQACMGSMCVCMSV